MQTLRRLSTWYAGSGLPPSPATSTDSLADDLALRIDIQVLDSQSTHDGEMMGVGVLPGAAMHLDGEPHEVCETLSERYFMLLVSCVRLERVQGLTAPNSMCKTGYLPILPTQKRAG